MAADDVDEGGRRRWRGERKSQRGGGREGRPLRGLQDLHESPLGEKKKISFSAFVLWFVRFWYKFYVSYTNLTSYYLTNIIDPANQLQITALTTVKIAQLVEGNKWKQDKRGGTGQQMVNRGLCSSFTDR